MRSKVCSLLSSFHHLLVVLFHLLNQFGNQLDIQSALHTFTDNNRLKFITLHYPPQLSPSTSI
jgi:hypothetical protein